MSTNPNTLLINRLIEFGMSDKEARIYLALIELEIASVQEVAKTAGINRSSAYVVLEGLKKRGLVSVSDDKNVRQYVATPPEALHQIAESEARKHEEIRKNIDDIVPELRALHKSTKARPKVRVFEGREGLIAAFEDSLDNKEKMMRVSSSPGNLAKIIPNYLLQYVSKRLGLGIKMNGIHPNDELHRSYIVNSPKNIDTYILVSRDEYKFPADLAIYDDKVGFMSNQDGGTAIIIESKVIAEVMKNIFDLAWGTAIKIGEEVEGFKEEGSLNRPEFNKKS